MRQPPAGVTIKEPRETTSGIKVDDKGFVVLSEWDIDRLATAIVAKLRGPSLDEAPETGLDAPLVPVRRNKADRPLSEYQS